MPWGRRFKDPNKFLQNKLWPKQKHLTIDHWHWPIRHWDSNDDYLWGIVSQSCWDNIDLVLKFLERYKIGKMSNNINNYTFRVFILVQTILFHENIICSRKTYLIKCDIEIFKLHYQHSCINKHSPFSFLLNYCIQNNWIIRQR